MTAPNNQHYPELKPPEHLPEALRAETLYHASDMAALNFETTNDLPLLQNVIGQPRAVRALEMGSTVTGPGFNIFASGLPDSGRSNLVRTKLEQKAASEPIPDDWCYINNFGDPDQPKALRLPAGQGKTFRTDMEGLIAACRHDIPRAFESEAFATERERLVEDVKKKQEKAFANLTALAEAHGFTIARAPMGFMLVPALEGRPLTPEEVEQLTPEQIAKYEEGQSAIKDEVEQGINHLRDLERAARERIRKLLERTARSVVDGLIRKLHTKYASLEAVTAYLEAVGDDLVASAGMFSTTHSGEQQAAVALTGPERDEAAWLRRYHVNVLVDNTGLRGAPVVLESQPSYHNLLGRLEHQIVNGATTTDFTQIKPGAVHRANGGYLILPARDVLLNPYTWDGLTRILRDGAIRIVEPGAQLNLFSTATIEPEPIPLNVKVVLIGTPTIYYLLSAYDEDFGKLFKVKAEFATAVPRTTETEQEYALFVKSIVNENHLPPFDRSAVARIIEHGARMVEDQKRLSARFGRVSDIVREAAYWAKQETLANDKTLVVTAAAVERAITERTYRNNLMEERIQELIGEGTLLIDVTGKTIGQVNALSVLMLGDYAFGHPTRITAIARPGQGGVVDIERRAELSGNIHTKGMLILSGCLGKRYGSTQPLSLTASIAFEQSYEGVDGDSASAAELCALLSAIAGIPLRQDRAITGSINQHGQIQAIGGVNEKIEGFFAVCKLKGLTGEQGVLIPGSNVRNLMLRDEVVKAVTAGEFHIWPIKTLDDALALLTDVEPGAIQPDRTYPEGTLNALVMSRLAEFNQVIKKASPERGENGTENGSKDEKRGNGSR